MEEVLKYIKKNIKGKIYMTDMAIMAGYSACHFSEKFREYTGENFKEYIQKRQMQISVKDIINGRNIYDIALEMGYETCWGFTRAFVREFNMTPIQYKKKHYENEKKYKKKQTSIKLSDCCSVMRNQLVQNGNPREFRGQRMYYFIKGYYEVPPEKRTHMNLMSKSLESVICGSKAIINDYEKIVGYDYDRDSYFIEVDRLYIDSNKQYLDMTEYLSVCGLSDDQKDEIIKHFTDMEDKYNNKYSNNLQTMGRQLPTLNEEEYGLICDFALVGYCSVNHHSLISYEKVLIHGFEGLYKWASSVYNKKLEHKIPVQDYKKMTEFYDGVMQVCRAACSIGEKYSRKAEELIENEINEKRKIELTEIKNICQKVPRYPSESFHEAVQCVWFVTILNTWEDGINGNSLGRLDQILYPYYKKDIEKYDNFRDKAFDLICMLLLKLYSKDNHQQIVLGGCDENGNSAVNELSYIFLDAVEALNLTCSIAVRYSAGVTEKCFIQRVFDVLRQTGNGVPVFFNDDVFIPSLIKHGIKKSDAANYAVVGCVEVAIPGKTNQHSGTGQCNLLKALEYTLNNGNSINLPDIHCGMRTGIIENFTTFNKLKEAVFIQMKHIIDTTCRIINHNISIAAEYSPVPFKSLLVDDCISKGADYNSGGPEYNYYQIMLLGFPNLIDSLLAIKTLVYDMQYCSLNYLVKQLKLNFPDENFRQTLIKKSPKYGNNIKDVNDIACEIFNYMCDFVDANKPIIGQSFHAQPYTYVWNTTFGEYTAASPDGRRKGESLAISMSPINGNDYNGLEALLNSLAALPNEKAPGTTAVVIDIEPYLFCDNNLDNLINTFLQASEKGLAYAQFNIADNETLNKAQIRPQAYKNLTVSVSGFSRKFIDLDKATRDTIVTRTKHSTI